MTFSGRYPTFPFRYLQQQVGRWPRARRPSDPHLPLTPLNQRLEPPRGAPAFNGTPRPRGVTEAEGRQEYTSEYWELTRRQ